MIFNMETLRQGANLKQSKSLLRIASNGQDKMYSYLSGMDDESTYTADNVKYILNMQGDIDWNRITDKTNALFSTGYSDQGNIIGILTNTNALLQDMLVYCPLEEAKDNLLKVLTIPVASKSILGKRYSVNGQSPLTFSLPVITKSGYSTYATVIHKLHSERFEQILISLDLDALNEEDMRLIANDLSFLSRTQELAIDVAKDKTIEIVDTSEWLQMGIKPANYYLAKQNTTTGWYAQDNILEIIKAKKSNALLPDFKIDNATPEQVKQKVIKEVITSESISRQVLLQATCDYFNKEYKDMLLYSQETALNQKAKATALSYEKEAASMKQVIMAYRSYMIDNIPKDHTKDNETTMLLNKVTRERLAYFASVCRNTIYKIGSISGLDSYTISLIAYGTDLTQVSIDEGKFFRAIMPEEFKKLYAAGKTATEKEILFFVDDFIKDDIDDNIEYVLNFKDGFAYDDQGILLAKASFKYNAKDAKIIFDEETGRYYAETKLGISLPEVGEEILVQVNNISLEKIEEINSLGGLELEYTPKSPSNQNLLFSSINNEIWIEGSVGYNNVLSDFYRYVLINNKNLNKMVAKKQYDLISVILNDYDRVKKYNLTSKLNFEKIICVNKDSVYETNYAIITIN